MQENKIKTGYSIVFLWKKKQNVENATHENIKKDIEKIIERADLQEENQ